MLRQHRASSRLQKHHPKTTFSGAGLSHQFFPEAQPDVPTVKSAHHQNAARPRTSGARLIYQKCVLSSFNCNERNYRECLSWELLQTRGHDNRALVSGLFGRCLAGEDENLPFWCTETTRSVVANFLEKRVRILTATRGRDRPSPCGRPAPQYSLSRGCKCRQHQARTWPGAISRLRE